MVQADLVDEDPVGLDAEEARARALETDRDVAEPDRAVAGAEQAARDDADRVREVDDPGVVGRELADAGGDVEHDGDGAERLTEPAGAGRLLADAAAGQRDRLVGEARLLTADAELDQDERRAVERAVELVGDGERAVVAGRVEQPLREAADALAALCVDVMQDDVGQVEPLALAREPGDQLGRVGRPTADDGELHCWTPRGCSAATSGHAKRVRNPDEVTLALRSARVQP